jgi:hypothetical protein
VVSGQLKREYFSWANFEKCTFFLDSDVPYWMAVGGVLVDAGGVGREGGGFFAQQKCKSPRISF